METTLNFGLIILIGLLAAFLLRKLRVPDVLSYILVGAVLGKSLFSFISPQILQFQDAITNLTLGFIAFIIGESFRWKELKEIGTPGIIVTTVQAVVTTLVVFLGFYILTLFNLIKTPSPTAVSIILAVTATATAPAATFMVLRQYKAKGPLTNYILLAVTLDDAIGIVFFDIALVIVKSILNGSKASISEAFLVSSKEIFISLILGALIGIILSIILRFLKHKDETLITPIAAVLIALGFAKQFNLSPLLINMVVGATLANVSKRESQIFPAVENWLPPLFLIFFILSGSTLDFRLITKGGIVILAYVILRFIGKIYGCEIGARVTKAPINVQKYLGFAMLSQAGVAIGFSVLTKNTFPSLSFINTFVLSAVAIFEILGPFGTRFAITRANEASIEEKH
ncbi:MAG: cation:proton antiporter [Fervidobacterium sp.]